MTKPKSDEQSDNRSQRQRFIDKARELEADEDEAAFRDKLRRIAKAPPPKPTKRDKGR